ncbi:lysophospholipid acyltransferase family protein [Leclercia adecarboxylata]|jgi:putative hemolysin|uniref:lysophospholipid acyltransferase family protein n=1 Tax=Leclercia adecarboxylata TaxID=83655 RepID=UPI0009818ED0|nr:GNAT family N-acyltransferase [Leclercia adecarboxylata]MBK0350974.1 lysophospholipid acyltransferase family protein [Leclercia adecarboxylata]MBZ3801104.1 lysophospholipid acyltransferase family protein [Leclercia adecarboxylata]MBZ3805664.1 lysophospholipid acyltransferase family protein [Leclercia adecarboxylata]OOB87059.1 GNAT family N-acetyltransferase [Leclercia adecarboxylata]QFH64022.1 lysophospholipid acyltransferase family protein [Leclercia adecarboxylata]
MFSLDSVLDDLWPQARPAPWQKRLLKKLFHEEEFRQFAADHRHLKGLDMVEQVLEHLDILCTLPAHDLEQIPAHGPLIVMANHPTGTLDGLALLYAVSRVRRDVKVVTNRMLTHLEPLSSLFIPVDNIGGRTAKSSFTLMEQHLQHAGVLIFFPAGEVSRPTRTGIRDKKWHPGFIKLAGKFRAPLLPVNIHARNSLLFYASTLLAPNLSMLLLMQQMFRRRHSRLPVKIGQQIGWSHWFSPTLSPREMAEQCRQHVLRLGKGLPGIFKTESAIARPEDRATLKRELAQAESLGTTADGKTIYLWQRNGQEEAPILRELGRLREIAFRAVGEGSGKRRDTDSFDDDYLHLILWDDEDLEIVGAYRFIPTAMREPEALYSYSLFHYDDKMRDILEHGIELGRSFIQPRYWGRRGLDYLWSGIGAYLARYPHYRYLFGPVSISGGLPPAARDLLVAFYRLWFPATHPLAASRRPYPASLPEVLAQFGGEDYVEDLTRLKSLLGNLGCGIPPLYKQYSELCEPGGVQFIDFGSDPSFNNCVDGLVLVDLCYLKANRYQRYIEAHLQPSPQPSP